MGAGPSALGGPYNFAGKHVFLTGGANGIGFAMAELLLRRGARVTLTDIADVSTAKAALEKSGSGSQSVKFIKADVGSYPQVSAGPNLPIIDAHSGVKLYIQGLSLHL